MDSGLERHIVTVHGDGVDDTGRIQAAIDAASGRAVIRLLNCRIGSTIHIRPDVTIGLSQVLAT